MIKDRLKVNCISMDEEGSGIVKIKGKTVHIPNLIKEETATVDVFENGNHIDARVVSIDKKDKNRIEPACPYFNRCGGCKLQHMSYEGQIEFKKYIAERLLKKYADVNDVIPMKNPYNYRNKVHSTFTYDKKRGIISGIYEEYSHRIVSAEQCMIQDKHANDIILSIREIMKKCKIKPYNEDTGYGFLRHVLIRRGFSSNQIMVVLVVSSKIFPGKNNFIKFLREKHPEIKTVVMNVNDRKTSIVLGNYEKVLYGSGYIEDVLCGCTFRISPKSFYQVNPVQTEILYDRAIEMAKLNKNETVLDAYCGIGTISLIAAKRVKYVIGVELNNDAVKDAIINAKINNIKNVHFYNEDAGKFMSNMAVERQKIDTVFMDPPRSGSDEKFLSSLIKLKPDKVIYISCNPVTLERDLSYLTNHGYKALEIQPVDMFPQTYHVETVVLLSKGEIDSKRCL